MKIRIVKDKSGYGYELHRKIYFLERRALGRDWTLLGRGWFNTIEGAEKCLEDLKTGKKYIDFGWIEDKEIERIKKQKDIDRYNNVEIIKESSF